MKQKARKNDFFAKNVNKDECLFYLYWLKKQQLKIVKADLNVKRKGLPKSGPHPMVRNKQFLALSKTLKIFKLKDFAEDFGVSYGVVRVWNREEFVKKKANDFRILFALDYVSKLEELLISSEMSSIYESFQDIFTYKLSLSQEFKHYPPAIQWRIQKLIENKIEIKENVLLWESTLSVLFAWLDKRNIFDPPKHPKMKVDFEQHTVLAYKVMAKLTKALFSDLKKSIESNNLKSAFFITDILKDQMLDNLEENTVLRLSVINNGKKRGRKDLEKLYNAAKR